MYVHKTRCSSWVRFLRIFIFAGAVCAGSGSCSTTAGGIVTDESIVASQISAERIQAANTVVREQIRLASAEIDDIRATARSIVDGIDRAYYLFEQYENLVHRIISGLGQIEQSTRIGEGEGSGPQPDTADGGYPFSD